MGSADSASARSSNCGFTLIELMIVVSIIGLLATIALPNYFQMVLRARRAEVPPNLASIRRAEVAYHVEWDVYLAAPVTPPVSPGRTTVDFGVHPTQDHPWSLLGWLPDGPVRSQYLVTTPGLGATFTPRGQTDADGNGELCVYEATEAFNVYMLTQNNVY